MLSFRARLFRFIIRHRHLLWFRRKQDLLHNTGPNTLSYLREDAEFSARFFTSIPKGIEVAPLTVAEMPAECIRPIGASTDAVLLYFHGGGYVAGSCRTHRGIAAQFVKGTGVPALLFEYRLAPEHPFPAALDDCISAYYWLLEKGIAPTSIVFVGDSAGGGLCLSALLLLRDQGIPLPTAAALLSPVTDLKGTGNSCQANAKRCLLSEGTIQALAEYYSGESDAAQPYISPLYGNPDRLPPLYLCAGADEILLDDSVRFAQKIKDAGGHVTLHVEDGLFHCYPVCNHLFPEASQSMADICGFIKSNLQESNKVRI